MRGFEWKVASRASGERIWNSRINGIPKLGIPRTPNRRDPAHYVGGQERIGHRRLIPSCVHLNATWYESGAGSRQFWHLLGLRLSAVLAFF